MCASVLRCRVNQNSGCDFLNWRNEYSAGVRPWWGLLVEVIWGPNRGFLFWNRQHLIGLEVENEKLIWLHQLTILCNQAILYKKVLCSFGLSLLYYAMTKILPE